MTKKIFTTILLLILTTIAFSQNKSNGKQIWAKSYLNKKAPEIKVSEWITKQPDTKGKFILVDFWATWCGPCRRFIPELNKFNKKFSDKLVIIGLSNESPETIKKMKSPVMEYYVASDSLARTKNKLEVRGIPHVILISPDGIVRWEGFPALPGYELTDKVIADIIKEYEKQNK
jgi:thiol-disulfide isomerase/thioredoxin